MWNNKINAILIKYLYFLKAFIKFTKRLYLIKINLTDQISPVFKCTIIIIL